MWKFRNRFILSLILKALPNYWQGFFLNYLTKPFPKSGNDFCFLRFCLLPNLNLMTLKPTNPNAYLKKGGELLLPALYKQFHSSAQRSTNNKTDNEQVKFALAAANLTVRLAWEVYYLCNAGFPIKFRKYHGGLFVKALLERSACSALTWLFWFFLCQDKKNREMSYERISAAW